MGSLRDAWDNTTVELAYFKKKEKERHSVFASPLAMKD